MAGEFLYPAPSTSYRAVDREIEALPAIVWEAGEPSTKIILGNWGTLRKLYMGAGEFPAQPNSELAKRKAG